MEDNEIRYGERRRMWKGVGVTDGTIRTLCSSYLERISETENIGDESCVMIYWCNKFRTSEWKESRNELNGNVTPERDCKFEQALVD